MKRTLGANRICLPGSMNENIRPTHRNAVQNTAATSIVEGLPDMSRLGLNDGEPRGMLRSRLNGSSISPRMELFGLFGSEIAQ